MGKYTALEDAYASVLKALNHAALFCKRKLNIRVRNCVMKYFRYNHLSLFQFVHAADLEANTRKDDPVKYHEAWQQLCSAQ